MKIKENINEKILNEILISYNKGMSTIIPSSVSIKNLKLILENEYINIYKMNLRGYVEYDNCFSLFGDNDTKPIEDTILIAILDKRRLNNDINDLRSKYNNYSFIQTDKYFVILASSKYFYFANQNDIDFEKELLEAVSSLKRGIKGL